MKSNQWLSVTCMGMAAVNIPYALQGNLFNSIMLGSALTCGILFLFDQIKEN